MLKKVILIFILSFSITFSKGYNISSRDLTEKIIAVNKIIFGTENLEHYNNLIAGTVAAETLYGKYKGNSPLGITQISPAGWGFIQSRLQEEDIEIIKIIGYDNSKVKFKDLAEDHLLAIMYCSLYYKYKLNGNIPNTLEDYAKAWKKYYNTKEGAGTIEGFKEKYLTYGKKYLNEVYF